MNERPTRLFQTVPVLTQEEGSCCGTEKLPWGQWLSVTKLNEQIRDLLEDALPFVRVRGEISDLRQPSSGHLYFTLVDEKSRIRAVIWRGNRQRIRMLPRSGDAVQATGRIAVYPPRGEYQLIIEGMQSGGGGSERERLLQLFARLKAEGLFAAERKKTLPFLPEVIGVVTSASGAAIHDIQRGLERRFPGYCTLVVEPARVQGEGAAAEIVAALKRLIEDGRSQVIICGRGGGSAEDLSAFNSEAVVRAIAASPVPVVSAVGHEVDWTLADWVADVRASTPTAAAERVMPEKKVLLANLEGLRRRLFQAALQVVQQKRHVVKQMQHRLIHPQRKIEFFRMRCDELTQRLLSVEHRLFLRRRQRLLDLTDRLSGWAKGSSMAVLRARLEHAREGLGRAVWHHLAHHRGRYKRFDAQLYSVSPLAVLKRGYAIIYDQHGMTPRDSAALHVGEKLRVVLAQGEVEAVITRLEEKP